MAPPAALPGGGGGINEGVPPPKWGPPPGGSQPLQPLQVGPFGVTRVGRDGGQAAVIAERD